MITFITGLPGNGKTLYAINYIKAYSEKENREVFYSGIKELQLPWTEIKAEEWTKMPAGAIIVIDEAQFVFPKKPNGSTLPEHYQKLAVHRHSGYDIFIITQHPSLVDNFVRQLCGRHLHIIRKFGMQRANVWEWAAANTAPEKAASHKSAVLHKFAYPKEIYSYYKSAEVHTHKRSIPMKLVLAVIFVIAVPTYGYYVLVKYQDRTKKEQQQASKPIAQAPTGEAAATAPGRASYKNAIEDAKQYVFDQTPRIDGLQHTAPKYDQVTAPVTAPIPAACVKMADKCKCYSQQGTILPVDQDMCQQIIERGFFVDFKQDQIAQAQPGYGQPYMVRADALRVPVDPQNPDQVKTAVGILTADNTMAGRTPEGVRARDQDAKGMGFSTSMH